VQIAISQAQVNPLNLSLQVSGPGFPLANANVDYALIKVQSQGGGSYPTYQISYGSTITDKSGFASLNFPGFDGNSAAYALIVSAHLSGLVGMGYFQHQLYSENYVIPFVNSFANKTAILAHSWDVVGGADPDVALYYNATFVVLAEDFKLHEMPFANETASAHVLTSQNPGQPYATLTMGTSNTGIVIVTYGTQNAQEAGIVVMPWGLSSLAFPMTFGGDPKNAAWVATDIRQVMVNGIAYQAKLAVWSLSGKQVNG
jgi:hypothetical protein